MKRGKGLTRLSLAMRLAMREIKGGLNGFRVFLASLALGVAAVAAVGSVRAAIEEGLRADGRAILGGDAEITMTYRAATEDERAWMEANALAVSEVVDFRSMATRPGPDGPTRGLTQVKGVDGAYPLAGAVELSPDMALADALRPENGRPGLVMEPALIARLGAEIGDEIRLGRGSFRLAAAIEAEPDRASGGFGLGPRIIVGRDALAETGLIAPGTLYETRYRLALPLDADPAAAEAALTAAFPDAGLRWRDRREAAPGVQRFVDRIGGFLVLVGLAALAVGGTGVASAIRAYLDEKTPTIAILKTVGASGADIFAIYLLQVGLLGAIGIAAGVAIGAGGPILLGPLLATALPVPAAFGIYPGPLAEAALYGALTALVFALWPLARAREIRPARLFRDLVAPERRWPAPRFVAMTLGVGAALAGAIVLLADARLFAAWFVLGVAVSLGLLFLLAQLIARAARHLGASRGARGRPALRLALGAMGGPSGDLAGVMLALGLGLTVLAAIATVERNLQGAFAEELPARSPAFFAVDIQNVDLDAFRALVGGDPATASLATAPMLRGVISRLDGVPAAEAEIDPEGAWILRGDRGVSYAAAPPEGTELLAGQWWAEDYAGPPLVSFSAEHAAELRLGIGDSLTVNILGREITAEIASLRRVDFSDLGINFLMIFDPGAFAGAPHTHIATVYAPETDEGRLMGAVADRFPTVTTIGVRGAIEQVAEALGRLSSAARWAAAITLLTGLVVLIGAAAAGERRRTHEAAVLKVLGASRGRILASFALRAGLTGAAAGLVAVAIGSVAGWAVTVFVLDAPFQPAIGAAAALVGGGALLSLAAGLLFALGPLSTPAARVLRAKD